MRSSASVFVALAVIFSLAACGGGSNSGGSTNASAARDCFEAWNANSNDAQQAMVAGKFTVAEVTRWLATDGRESSGCSYVFHTKTHYLSLGGQWKDRTLRWGMPPTARGRWTPQRQATVHDNGSIDSDGLLSSR